MTLDIIVFVLCLFYLELIFSTRLRSLESVLCLYVVFEFQVLFSKWSLFWNLNFAIFPAGFPV